MSRTTIRLALFFVGGHLLLGLILLGIEATHGINDQDASFAVAILFHYLNLPTVWVLQSLRVTPEIILVLLAGTVQWAIIGLTTAALYQAFRSGFRVVTGRTNGADTASCCLREKNRPSRQRGSGRACDFSQKLL